MANLTFVAVSETAKQSANAGHLLARKVSPFRHGTEFTLTGFDYRHPEEDGTVDTDTVVPVLLTSVGELFVSRLTRRYVTHDNKRVQCGGDFVDLFIDTVAKNASKTDGEIFTAFIKAVGDRKVVVTLREYVGEGKYGKYSADVADFNFKVD